MVSVVFGFTQTSSCIAYNGSDDARWGVVWWCCSSLLLDHGRRRRLARLLVRVDRIMSRRPASALQREVDLDANIRNFAPVARIMKLALPENAKIAKEAKECMQECVSEFISFITSEGVLSLFSIDDSAYLTLRLRTVL